MDRSLGIGEVILVLVSLRLLLYLYQHPSRRWLSVLTVVVAALAVTVAQPFGMVRRDTTTIPSSAKPVAPQSTQVAHLAGVPFRFRLYRRDAWWQWATDPIDGNLRARSSLAFPLFTNGAQVAGLCPSEREFQGCWRPTDGDPAYKDTLRLFKSGDSYWVAIANRGDEPGYAGVWKLSMGIASFGGFLYWMIAGGGLALAWLRLRRTPPTTAFDKSVDLEPERAFMAS